MSRLAVLLLLGALLRVGQAHAEADDTSSVTATQSLAQLPPAPGPMPTQFVDVYAYEATLRLRLRDITVREAGLTQLGSAASAVPWRRIGWVTFGAGLTTGVLSFSLAMSATEDLPFRTAVVTGLIGGVASIAGLTILLSVPKNPYRREIGDLHREGERVKYELRRLRWERQQTQLSVSPRGVSLTTRF